MNPTGHYFVERITTGSLCFTSAGILLVTKTKHHEVNGFRDHHLAEELLTKPMISNVDLKPNTEYMRLFKVPDGEFNADGELKPPQFHTIGFFEKDKDFYNVVSEGCLYLVVDTLPEASVHLFGEPQEIQVVRFEYSRPF